MEKRQRHLEFCGGFAVLDKKIRKVPFFTAYKSNPMMKYIYSLILVAYLTNLSQAQEINYSSQKKYQKIRLGVKYPVVVKKAESVESEKVAMVQMPVISNKKQIYGSLIKK